MSIFHFEKNTCNPRGKMPPLKLPRFFLFISLQALWSQVLDASFEGSCLLGGFYFVSGRNMVVDHSIQGAGFLNLTVSSPRECFRECSWNCRCISFNFRRSLHSKPKPKLSLYGFTDFNNPDLVWQPLMLYGGNGAVLSADFRPVLILFSCHFVRQMLNFVWDKEVTTKT